MKKFIHLFTLLILLPGCRSNNPIIINIPADNFKNGVYITIDPRMELLAVVQHFTAWAEAHHTGMNFNYVNKVKNYFSSFTHHPAITKCQELIDNGFVYDAPVNFILFHDYPPG